MVKHVNLHKRFPFLNSIISLVFGAVSSCLFQSVVDSWRNKGTIHQKLGAGVLFLVIIVVAFFYYRSFYADYIKKTTLEKEKEKSEIQRIKKESELVASLYDQGTKEMNNENLTIMQKTEIYKQISLVINDNKRETNQNNE